MPKSIGVFGNGHWSKTIQSKLTSFGPEKIKLIFIADSKSDYLSRLNEFKLDWAIVASTNSTHYEIVESCLQKGISVFCEKPLVSHPKEAKDLYELAKRQNTKLYVDDVFMWRNDTKEYLAQPPEEARSVEGRWFKAEDIRNPRQCLNDFLYHHLYLIGELVHFSKNVSVNAAIEHEQLHVEITAPTDQSFNLKYGLNHTGTEHIFDTLDFTSMPNDALQDMFNSIFAQTADLASNQRRTMWATEMLYKIKGQVMPTVGVIGGGIFGGTAAILLANEGCEVTVYQKTQDLMQGASAKNQLRVHRGYHYPRSKETALSAKRSEAKFKSYYRAAVDDTNRHLYAIAKIGSRTTPAEFEQFMDEVRLSYKKLGKDDAAHTLFREGMIAAIYEVKESLYSPDRLREILKRKFSDAHVRTKFGHEVDLKTVQDKHQYIISATYANPVTTDQEYQFEVCEKPMVKLPDEFKKTSILILDGPFMGVDPVPFTPYHILDSVKDAIHHTNIGIKTEVPEYLQTYMEKSLIKKPEKSRYKLFIRTGQKFYTNFNPVEYKGSYFVVRAVLPYRDHDDARPSIIRQIDKDCYEVFSGKVSTAPYVGQKLVHDLLYADDNQS
jgi:D-amino-acid oxidase